MCPGTDCPPSLSDKDGEMVERSAEKGAQQGRGPGEVLVHGAAGGLGVAGQDGVDDRSCCSFECSMLRSSSGIASSSSFSRIRTSAIADRQRRSAGDLGDGQVQARVEAAVVRQLRRRRSPPGSAAGGAARRRSTSVRRPPPRPRSPARHAVPTRRPATSPSSRASRLAGVRRGFGSTSLTNVPPYRPRRDSTYPASVSARIASRRVTRLTFSRAARSRSDGSRSPGTTTPSLIACSNRSTVSSNGLPVRTGRNNASSAWATMSTD